MFLPWLALQGLAFWLPWFWRIQDRSWRGLAQAWVKAMTYSNWVLSRCWCIGCTSGGEAGWLWFGTFTTNLHFLSTLFCHISQVDNCRAWIMFVFFFLPLDVSELIGNFPQNHIWLWYFSLFSNFWLLLNSCSILHDYSSIEAALLQNQILLKEVMLNQKVVRYSWLMIKTFLCQFWSGSRVFSKTHRVFSKTHRVFEFFSLVKICVVYSSCI